MNDYVIWRGDVVERQLVRLAPVEEPREGVDGAQRGSGACCSPWASPSVPA